MDRPRRPRLREDQAAGLPAARGCGRPGGLHGDDPFIMHVRRQGVAVRARGRRATAAAHALRAARVARAQPALRPAGQPGRARSTGARTTRSDPAPPEALVTCSRTCSPRYRLTEHHTAGGMSRWLPYLSELQPELFCEVSPELARRARPASTSAGPRHHPPHRDRGPGAGHRADDAAARATAAPCTRSGCRTTGARPGCHHRRLGQRPARRVARSERAHPGDQGR